ncbi:MAG: hypothetical protein KH369_08735 [Paraclostridium bifermentans]|uniref:hypothetical protein n=1 Tax=Paraclostridium bifermentans TaxID=1490 RepID=UPI0011DC8535|nr:hypothetical protein [Paraclostridium bifermentans]MBS6508275.1 hypothetical protein [Paraclostridium bifermentans]
MSKVNRSNNDKSRLCRFGYVDYIVLASSLAIAVAEEVNATDLNILASFFATFSDELALIASVKQGCSSDSDSDNDETTFVPPIPATSGSRSKPKIKKRKKIKKYKKV